MIVCRTCGGHNADGDTFCGSCGEFLEWTGEKLQTAPEQAEPAATPVSAAPPVPATPPVTTPSVPAAEPDPPAAESASAAAGSKPAAGEVTSPAGGFKPAVGGFKPAVGGAATTGGGPKPAVTAPKPPVREPAAVPEPTPGREPGQPAAAALVAPPTPSTGPKPSAAPTQPDRGQLARKPQPQEMRPQEPVRRRPTAPTTQSPPTRDLQPDDLICGMCGEGNPPTRRFCSRCGNSLQTATVVPTPWWRKVLRFFTQRRVHPAGARPKRRPRLLTLSGGMALVRRVLLVAVLLSGLLYAVSPSMRQAVNETVGGFKNRIESAISSKPVPVRPIKVTASAALPGHAAELATDLDLNTYWAAPHAGQPKLVVDFERPTHLTQAIIHNGAADKDFDKLARPRDLVLVYSHEDGSIATSPATLTDSPDEQRIPLSGGDGVIRVEIQVLNVHGGPQSPDLALSEIEFGEQQ